MPAAPPPSAPPESMTVGSGAPPNAPVAPVAPPPTPEAKAPAPESGKYQAGQDAFGELDKLAGLEKADEKPPEKAPDIKEPEKKEAPAPDDKNLKTAELRKRYDEGKAKVVAHEKRIAELEKKLAEAPNDSQRKAIEDKLAAAEKRLADVENRAKSAEEELKFSNFTKTNEYKELYEKPFVDAWVAANSKVSKLKISQKLNEDGEVVRAARQATPADFEKLMSIDDDDEAAEFAADLFGAKSTIAMYHREHVSQLNNKRSAAVEEYRTKGAEREKAQRESFENGRKELNGYFTKKRDEAIEKYPGYFKDDPNDPEGNTILSNSRKFVDRVFGMAELEPGEAPMTQQQMADATAVVYNKAMGFDRLARKAGNQAKRIKELETKLAEYESSKPGEGDKNGSERTAAPSSGNAALDAFDRKFGKGGWHPSPLVVIGSSGSVVSGIEPAGLQAVK